MYGLDERIIDLEYITKDYRNELRRIKSSINKLEKLGLNIPTELLYKKEKVENDLKEFKQELKALKKVAELIK